MSLLFNLSAHNLPASICGFRYWLVFSKLEACLQRMRDAGATLVFYADGPPQASKLNVYSERQDRQYQITTALTDALNNPRVTLLDCVRSPQLGGAFRTVPEFNSLRQLIQRRLGDINVAMDRECDVELVQYANCNGAMAVLGQDSDYLIFAGDWQYWSSNKLDLVTGHTVRFDRNKLRNFLGLTDAGNEMAMFAAMCGTGTADMWPWHCSLIGRNEPPWRSVMAIADWVRAHRGDAPAMATAAAAVAQLCGIDVQLLWQARDSYDTALPPNRVPMAETPLWRIAHGSLRALTILGPYATSMSLCSFDHRHPRLLDVQQLCLPMLKRQAGIVWSAHRREASTQHGCEPAVMRVRTCLSHSNGLVELELVPLYPNCEHTHFTNVTKTIWFLPFD